MSDQQDFDQGTAGSSDTIPTQCGSIKKGGYCMLKGFPCKVTEYSTAKPGKHGSAKATIVGLDIFTGKKYEDTAPTGATLQVPIVTKEQFEIADVDADDMASLIDPNDGTLRQVKLDTKDEETYNELKKIWDENNEKAAVFFTLQKSCGQQKLVSGRAKEH